MDKGMNQENPFASPVEYDGYAPVPEEIEEQLGLFYAAKICIWSIFYLGIAWFVILAVFWGQVYRL